VHVLQRLRALVIYCDLTYPGTCAAAYCTHAGVCCSILFIIVLQSALLIYDNAADPMHACGMCELALIMHCLSVCLFVCLSVCLSVIVCNGRGSSDDGRALRCVPGSRLAPSPVMGYSGGVTPGKFVKM